MILIMYRTTRILVLRLFLGVGNLRPPGPICPTGPFDPACYAILKINKTQGKNIDSNYFSETTPTAMHVGVRVSEHNMLSYMPLRDNIWD